MAYCFDNFALVVTGSRVACVLDITSPTDDLTYSIDDLGSGASTGVAFTYRSGSPARTVWASSYTSARAGAPGNPPALANRAFSRPAPDVSGSATDDKNAAFTFQIPAYSDATTLEVGDTDRYDITIYMLEATDTISPTPSNYAVF